MIQSQKGASLISIGIIIVVVLFFAKFGIETIPKYLTHLEYQKHIKSTLSKLDKNQVVTKRQFYEAFSRTVATSNWTRKVQEDVVFVRKDNKYVATLKYTAKSNLFHDIDVSISFDETFTTE